MVKMLATRSLPTAEYQRGYFHVVVDADVSADDVLVPAFWGHHAAAFKPGSLIDILRRDNTLDMQVRVIETGKGFAKVRELRRWEDAAAAAQIVEMNKIKDEINSSDDGDYVPPEYKIGYTPKGTNAGFNVTYKPTDARVCVGIALRPDAVRLARAHAANLGLDLTPPVAETVEILDDVTT